MLNGGWIDSLGVKSTDSSSRRLKFAFVEPMWQLPEDPMPSSGLYRHCIKCGEQTYM